MPDLLMVCVVEYGDYLRTSVAEVIRGSLVVMIANHK